MTADISLSNGQYEIDVNSNGNLIIKDSTDTIILKHEDGGAFSLGADLQLGDLVDGSTGDTVYDGSTETIGNGTQTVDANSVNTDNLSLTPAGTATFSMSGGQTTQFAFGGTFDSGDLGTPIIATAVPNNDPDNDVGFVVDGIIWRETANEIRVEVSETENAGGGEVYVIAWTVGV